VRLGEIDRGSRGQEVQILQHLLNTVHNPRPPLELDGVFGPMTERAVRSYQLGKHLGVDGIVGTETWRSLGATGTALPERSAAPAKLSPPRSLGAGTPTRAVGAPSVRQLPIGNAPVSRSVAAAAAGVAPAAARAAPMTAAAPAAARPAPRRSPQLEQPGTAIGAPWMRIALAEDGVHEIAGREHTKRILEYHRATSLGARTDEVPWCSSFVNWCLKQVGIAGTNSALAASWRKWGTELDTPRYGCIVQIRQKGGGADAATGSSTGNHVAFFIRGTATSVTLLGGNQRNSVKQSTYPLRSYEIKALRWPTGR